MTLLAGAPTSEIATVYTSNSFSGFGGGVFCKPSFTAAVAGTANNLITAINDFGSDTLIRCHIYRQVGNTGNYSLVTSVDVPSGSAPQTTAISSPFSVSVGDEFVIVFIGDVSGSNGSSAFFRASYDPSIATSSTTGLSGRSYTYYASPPSSLDIDAISGEADGRIFFQLDGALASSTNSGIRIRLETKGSQGTALPDRVFKVTVTDLSLSSVISPTQIRTVSGLLEIDSETLGTIGTKRLVHIQDEHEDDIFAASRSIQTFVMDLDAGSVASVVYGSTCAASGTVT